MALRRRRYRLTRFKIALREIYIKAMCPAYAGVLCALTTLGAKPEGAALRHPRGQPPWERGQARRTPGEPVMGPRGVVKRERERETRLFADALLGPTPTTQTRISSDIRCSLESRIRAGAYPPRGDGFSRRNQPTPRSDSARPRSAQFNPYSAPIGAQIQI